MRIIPGALITLCMLCMVLPGTGCTSGDAGLEGITRGRVVALLDGADASMERAAGDLEKIYTRARDKHHVTAALVNWAAMYPQRFSTLARHFTPEGFADNFAVSAAQEGKAFLLVERLDGNSAALQPLLEAMRNVENRDRRAKVPAYRMAPDSPLQRVARLSAVHDGQVWEGGAMLLLESQCQLAFAAAGHTFSGETGELRAPLANFELGLAGRVYRVAEVVASPPSVAPENDWALVIVNKDYCGGSIAPEAVALPAALELPHGGLEVKLYCYQQGRADMAAHLYEEQCRIYPSDSGVLDHYADKPSGLVGVHSCRSEKGSSGCPLMVNKSGGLQFIGTQIERDAVTRAGIARLFSAEFRLALAEIRERFAADDEAYVLKHRP